MAYQSLYRRYRSQKFSELRGQSHVTSALRTAIQANSFGHAYLFSGPRGTGKTSTARILAKALNCNNLQEGEPCSACESCLAIEQGKSFDLYELDAASHNKVDDVRDLIAKVHLGSPGRTKVYILDEVHMLSSGAENALLKTLEEPPPHVVFVLATTEPHKVVATIRSRTQHFRFNLLPADELDEHLRWVIEDAGLDVGDDAIEYALRQGGGSARDTLSALDLVAAAGGVPVGSDVGTLLTEAIGEGDPERAIAVIQEGLVNGQEPRVIGESTVEVMRNAFLAAMGASLDHLHDSAQQSSQTLAASLGPATLTRAMEDLGQCLVDMRQAPDPRVPLDVAVLRLCRAPNTGAAPGAAASNGSAGSGADSAQVAALEQRIATLESLVAELRKGGPAVSPPAASSSTTSTPATSAPAPPPPAQAAPAETPARTGPADMARQRLAEVTSSAKRPASPRQQASNDAAPTQTPAAAAPPPANPQPVAAAEPAPQPAASEPSAPNQTSAAEPAPQPQAPVADGAGQALQTGLVAAAWSDLLDNVSKRTRVRFKGNEIMSASDSTVVLGVPNSITADRCKELSAEVEEALSTHFGRPITLQIMVNDGATAPTDPAKIDPEPTKTYDETEADIGPVDELEDATGHGDNSIDRLSKAFPGSKVIEQDPDHQETP